MSNRIQMRDLPSARRSNKLAQLAGRVKKRKQLNTRNWLLAAIQIQIHYTYRIRTVQSYITVQLTAAATLEIENRDSSRVRDCSSVGRSRIE